MMVPRILWILLCVGVVTASACGQRGRSPVGLHPVQPELLHPLIQAGVSLGTRSFTPPELVLHDAIPLKVRFTPTRTAGTWQVEADPGHRTRKLVVPGILDLKFRFGRRAQHDHRFEIGGSGRSLTVRSVTGATLKLSQHTVVFLDLDHDGAFGSPGDGFIAKPPKQRQWMKPGEKIPVRRMDESWDFGTGPVWFRMEPSGLRVAISSKAPPKEVALTSREEDVLAQLNALRDRYGFKPVVIDESLNLGCQEHALYCSIHGLTHIQDKSKEGASKKGAVAGENGVVATADSLSRAYQYWRDSFFHRIYLIHPGTSKVGVGFVDGVAVMNLLSHFRNTRFTPFAYPYAGQEDVPVSWQAGENPHPRGGPESMKAKEARTRGFPITLTFPTEHLREVSASLLLDGVEVPAFVSSPENPSQGGDFANNMDSVFLMADRRLQPGKTYTVEIRCIYNDKPFERTWSFSTATQN